MLENFSKLNIFTYEESYRHRISLPDIINQLNVHFAQCAEDLIVAALLRAYATKYNVDIAKLTYCEIGGNHPIAASATYLLQVEYGMRGVIVEANPALISDLKKVRNNDTIVHAAVSTNDEKFVLLTISNDSELSSLDHAFVENWPGSGGGVKEQVLVPSKRITQIIEDYFPDTGPDYLSIDVEGLDFNIIQDLDLSIHRPYIIQMEPSDHHIPNNSENMIAHMKRNNYTLLAKTDVNLIFIDINCINI